MNHVPEPTADEKVKRWRDALEETTTRGFVDSPNFKPLYELLEYLDELLPKEERLE